MDRHSPQSSQRSNTSFTPNNGDEQYNRHDQYVDNASVEGDRPNPNQGMYSTESILLNRLTTEIDELKHAMMTQQHQASTEAHRLRRQVRWLTVLSTVAIVLIGGSLIGVSLNLRQEQIALRENQQQLAAQLDILQAERMNPEELSRLESLLSSLNQATGDLQGQAQQIIEQLPGASREQLEALQGDLEDLQQDIQEGLSQEEGGVMDRVNDLYKRIQDFFSRDNSDEEPAGE